MFTQTLIDTAFDTGLALIALSVAAMLAHAVSVLAA